MEVSVLVFTILCFGSTFACDGYQASIIEVKPCLPGAPIFKSLGGTLNVSDTCDVSSNACSIIQPYSTFKMELRVFDPKTGIPLEHEGIQSLALDMCTKESPVIPDLMKLAMVAYGIAPICPVTQPIKHCYDETSLFTIKDKLRRLLPLYAAKGAFKIVMTTIHDTGSTCLSILAAFQK